MSVYGSVYLLIGIGDQEPGQIEIGDGDPDGGGDDESDEDRVCAVRHGVVPKWG